MKSKNVWATCLAIIFLTGFWTSAALAQQSGTPPKPLEDGSSPSTSARAAETPGSAAPSRKVVLKVGTTQVTQSEVESLISELSPRTGQGATAEGRRHIGEAYVRMALLSQQALHDHLDSSPALRSRLELQRTKILAQAEYEKMRSEVKVSPDEVGQYYTAHQPEFDTIQVREFLIRKEPAGAEGAEARLTAENSKIQAESIRKALAARAEPEKVAADFAAHNVTLIDPKPRTLRRGEMVPALEKATWELKDGEVSEPVDTPQAFLVVLVVSHGHHEQKEVTTEIEKKLQQQKLEAAFDDLRRKAGAWMDEDYFKGAAVATPASAAQPPASAPTPKSQ
jgi:hypothetical protein